MSYNFSPGSVGSFSRIVSRPIIDDNYFINISPGSADYIADKLALIKARDGGGYLGARLLLVDW